MAPPCARSLCVAKENVVTEDVLLRAKRSEAAMAMLTLCTRPCTISRLVPLDAASSDVEIVSPKAFALTANPVVNSPAANVTLLAPTPRVAFEIVQTTRSSEAVMVQGVESAAVPPGGGTSTPTGLDLALKYCAGNPMVMVPPTGRLAVDVNEKITGEVVAFNMNKSFATIAILTDWILATI